MSAPILGEVDGDQVIGKALEIEGDPNAICGG
jgi:hypothetical protein